MVSVRIRIATLVGVAGLGAVGGLEYGRARRAARRWRAPAGVHRRAAALAVRTLGDAGPPVVLLHGLVGSGVFWGAAYDGLAERHRLIVPDLLGFGASDRPNAGYGPDDHVQALIDCLDALDLREPVALGAHSLGCLVALRLAATHPDRVAGIVGFGPPLYRDGADARARIGASGPMARLLALPGPVAEHLCGWMCEHRDTAGHLAVLLNPGLPAAVAADAVQHNWISYSETLTRVILDTDAAGWLDSVNTPITFVAGDRDPVVDLAFLDQLTDSRPHVSVEVWPGGHDLPLVEPERCADTMARVLLRARTDVAGHLS